MFNYKMFGFILMWCALALSILGIVKKNYDIFFGIAMLLLFIIIAHFKQEQIEFESIKP